MKGQEDWDEIHMPTLHFPTRQLPDTTINDLLHLDTHPSPGIPASSPTISIRWREMSSSSPVFFPATANTSLMAPLLLSVLLLAFAGWSSSKLIPLEASVSLFLSSFLPVMLTIESADLELSSAFSPFCYSTVLLLDSVIVIKHNLIVSFASCCVSSESSQVS